MAAAKKKQTNTGKGKNIKNKPVVKEKKNTKKKTKATSQALKKTKSNSSDEETADIRLPAPVIESDEEDEIIPPPEALEGNIEIDNVKADSASNKKRALSDNDDIELIKVPKKKKTKANNKKDQSTSTKPRKHQSVNKHKLELPKEHLRRVFGQNKDINAKKFFNKTKKTQLSALKYLPYGILKLIENMPQPWEAVKKVKVLYHTSGAITFINEVPKVIPPVYIAQWSNMYDEMRVHKRDNFVQRLKFPVFDDDMEIYDYEKDIEGLPIPSSISLEYDYLRNKQPFRYDDKNIVNNSYRNWELNGDELVKLFDLSDRKSVV